MNKKSKYLQTRKLPPNISMKMESKQKDLLIAAYINDNETKVTSLYKKDGDVFETWMVLALEDAERFIKEHQKESKHNLLILSQYRVGRQFADDFIVGIEDYKFPISKAKCWYDANSLRKVVDKLNKITKHKPTTKFSKKKNYVWS